MTNLRIAFTQLHIWPFLRFVTWANDTIYLQMLVHNYQ